LSFHPSELPPCPAAGTGVHSWILAAANYCHRDGLSEAEAERIISARMSRLPRPPNEVQTAIRKAYSSQWRPSGSFAPTGRRVVSIIEVGFDLARLRAVADKITQPANWRHWLWERSPKRPEAMNAYSFLAHLYRPEEK